MNKKMARLISFVLCGVMLLSFTSCKKSEKPNKKPSPSTPSVESSVSEIPSELPLDSELPIEGELPEEDFFGDSDNAGDIGDEYTDPESYEIIVDRPETAGLISSGIKLAYTFEDDTLDEDLEGEGGIDDDFFIDEDIDL